MKQMLLVFSVLAIFSNACKTPSAMTASTPKDSALTGTHWTLVSVEGAEGLKPMREAYIQFDAEKSAAYGCSGCNRMTGKFTLDGKKLHIGPMAGTRMACDEASMKLEQAIHQALIKVDGYKINGNQLQLLQGEKVLASFQVGSPEK